MSAEAEGQTSSFGPCAQCGGPDASVETTRGLVHGFNAAAGEED